MLYITHDLASARYVANRTTVMFAGELVESGDSVALMSEPAHPYTQLLLSAAPDPERASTYDPVERARLRSAVLHAEVMSLPGRRRKPLQRNDRSCGTTSGTRPTGIGCAATSTARPPTSARALAVDATTGGDERKPT